MSGRNKPLIMGVLNLTPDSFHDGGRYVELDSAHARAEEMIAEGADIIDIGGQSTHPRAPTVSLEEELARVMPFIKTFKSRSSTHLSIDTSRVEVMAPAIAEGVDMINDVTGLACSKARGLVASCGISVCVMHQRTCEGLDISEELDDFFTQKITQCLQAGIKRSQLILDPGFGFNKSLEQNLQVVKHLDKLQRFELPVMLGVSNKGTISRVTGCKPAERLWGSLALNCLGLVQGVRIFRVHEVGATRCALDMSQAVLEGGE